MSDTDHYHSQVKRQNLVQLFLDTQKIDQYISTHLYGAIVDVNNESFYEDNSVLINSSVADLSSDLINNTFDRGRKASRKDKQVA